MEKKKYMIGLDVGGTKTLGVLFTQDGEIIYKSKTEGGTMLDFGFDCKKVVYRDTLAEIASHSPEKISAAYCSVATVDYFGNALNDYLKTELPFEKIRCEEDGLCIISGMLGHNDGCCVICGTGSSLFVRKGETHYRLGGWGYLIDSCGSGYVLGARAIRAAVRAKDGRRKPTLLNEIFKEKLGCPIWDIFPQIYSGGRAYIASFADCVFEARKRGDEVASVIFTECAYDLAELIQTGYKHLGKTFDVVFNGGIFVNHPEYADEVKKNSPKEANIIYSDVPPIYGCAVEAMHDIGLECDESFKNKFMSTL